MEHLFNQLKAHHDSNIYPFHMPGHKRNMKEFGDFYNIDITEIEGFDNLHHAEGVLKEAQIRAAKLYGSKETHFLVNGSTVGLLSAIAGTTNKGDKILVARNCHKAVYNSVFLNELEVEYLYPEEIKGLNIAGGISWEKVESLINKEDAIKIVVITSPTYEGVVSDVEKIAKVVHQCGKILIVDEAHGAHFGFHPYFPKSAIEMGADVVIQSLHKTMPSLTQSALIHINLEETSLEYQKIRDYLSIYQTSSPSYLLMGSIDYCLYLLDLNGRALFEKYVETLENCRVKLNKFSNIKLLEKKYIGQAGIFDLDYSKLVLMMETGKLNGNQLYDTLRKDYNLELEMSVDDYALAMTSCMDSQEGFQRLILALKEIDEVIENKEVICNNKLLLQKEKSQRLSAGVRFKSIKRAMKISDAKKAEGQKMDFQNSAGYISKEYIYLYPPGIPLILPGEVIEEELINQIKIYKDQDLNVQGLQDNSLQFIEVVS